MTKTVKLLAINSVQSGSNEVELVGYREDGSAITKMRIYRWEPGDIFEVPESTAAYLIDLGAATTDLTYVEPERVNVFG